MRVRTGSIVCEQSDPQAVSPGNLIISISHSPYEKLVIERADIPDLITGLRKLGHLEPIQSILAIGAWIRGDGTNAQRVAIADGVLENFDGNVSIKAP